MSGMLVVLDTNILVSALLSPYGPPARILDLALAAEVRLAMDDRILAEYREVLARPKFGFAPEDAATLLDFLQAEGDHVVALPLLVELRDADDLPFLEVATQAGAVPVTGNRSHYAGAAGAEPTILTPREFLHRWGR